MESWNQLKFLKHIDYSIDSSFIIIIGHDADGALYIGFPGTGQNKRKSFGTLKLLEALIQKLRSIQNTSQICRASTGGYLLTISLVFIDLLKAMQSLEDLLPDIETYDAISIFIKIRKYMYLAIVYETNQLSVCRNLVRTIISYAYINRDYIKIYFLSPIKILNLLACALKKHLCHELKYLANKYEKQRFVELIRIIHTMIIRSHQQEATHITSAPDHSNINESNQNINTYTVNQRVPIEHHINQPIGTNSKNRHFTNNPEEGVLIKTDAIKDMPNDQYQRVQTQSESKEINSETTNFLVVIIDPIFTKKKIITHPIIIQKLLKETF